MNEQDVSISFHGWVQTKPPETSPSLLDPQHSPGKREPSKGPEWMKTCFTSSCSHLASSAALTVSWGVTSSRDDAELQHGCFLHADQTSLFIQGIGWMSLITIQRCCLTFVYIHQRRSSELSFEALLSDSLHEAEGKVATRGVKVREVIRWVKVWENRVRKTEKDGETNSIRSSISGKTLLERHLITSCSRADAWSAAGLSLTA